MGSLDHSERTNARRFAVLALVLLGEVSLASAAPAVAQDGLPLEQLLTREEQAKLGIEAMSPEKREAMRRALIRMFRQGYRTAQRADRPGGVATATDVVETQMDGDFNGWQGQTIIKLIDGQVWQQIEYHYEYHYAYMPKVLIYSSGGSYKLRVDGTSRPIGVQRLR